MQEMQTGNCRTQGADQNHTEMLKTIRAACLKAIPCLKEYSNESDVESMIWHFKEKGSRARHLIPWQSRFIFFII